MSDPSIFTFSLQPDNPCNTTLVDEDGAQVYAVQTDFSDEKKPKTRVCDALGYCIAEWIWRDTRSDLLTLRDRPQIPASAWLHKSLVPIKDVYFAALSLSKTTSGGKYKWKNNSPGVYPQLFSAESKERPIARFRPALKNPEGRKFPPLQPAQLLLDARADEIRDMVIVSFLLLERRRREASTESENRASAIAVPLVTTIVRFAASDGLQLSADTEQKKCSDFSSQLYDDTTGADIASIVSRHISTPHTIQMSSTKSKLFQPVTVGNLTLQHRVVMAPLTRLRASPEHVHLDMATEYYAQRACMPGTLLITEATFIAAKAGGFAQAPGIWSDAQIAAWRKVTDAVHAKDSFIFLQLWAIGRCAEPAQLASEDPSFPYVSAGDIQLTGKDRPPRPMTVEEIKEYVQLYATAASNAVHRAGFDGVEVHAANGYLPDQFLQDVSNNRTDQYGGSVENRARFVLEVLDAVVKAVGEKAVGIRFSPWAKFLDMRMRDPIPTFSHVITRIRDEYPDIAYLHLVEPGISGFMTSEREEGESNDVFRAIWSPKPLLSAGGYTREDAIRAADEKGVLVVFGHYFISNPDLVLRLKKDIPLTPFGKGPFYIPKSHVGYTDWPFATDSRI
ncbi:hypothetical protein EW146_g231 [Bondarzewia mesenterica]|uniref:Uncharacterized protein n=1 Tax=Bondarzewia mesenterica TaxID=1095465 RepID=A0A4S4M7L0_9AGAM|nr:hypothetical protein EW146_g231 [Bondarzewia mesenterica]